MATAALAPTKGQIRLQGIKVDSSLNDLFMNVGMCPQ